MASSKKQVKIEDPTSLYRHLKEDLYNSTAQACFKAYESPHITIKLFWAFCLLATSSLMAFFIVQSLFLFFGYEVIMTTRTHYEMTPLYPKVTLCNKNPLQTSYAYDISNGSNYEELIYLINTKFNDSQRTALSHSLKDILFECEFNTKACTHEDFILEYDQKLGNCFVFNSGINVSNGNTMALKESMRAGPSYGLKLVFYVNFYQKLYTDYKYNRYAGAIIKIGMNFYY